MSKPSRRILLDTFGPVKFRQDGGANFNEGAEIDDEHADDDVEYAPRRHVMENATDSILTDNIDGSSTHSSMSELTAAQERGTRTQFRTQYPGLETTVTKIDDDKPSVKVSDVHVRSVPGDIMFDSPASIASSTQRFFLSKDGHQHGFGVGNLQQNSNYRETMRNILRKHQDSDTNNNMSASFSPPQPAEDDSDGSIIKFNYSEPKTYCWAKCAAFAAVVVLIATGIGLLIFFNKDDSPARKTGHVIIEKPEEKPDRKLCSTLDVNLRDPISLTCVMSRNTYINPKQLRIHPPAYVNRGNTLSIKLNSEESEMGWSGNFDRTSQTLSIQGPAALCSSTGLYGLQLLDSSNVTLYNSSARINVKSEVLKVNVSLSQEVTLGTTDFTISCETNSGCEQSFVDFFAEVNQEEQYLRGVNFTCIITYNDYDGYSVSCTGTIPDFLLSQFSRITCRPRSTLLDELEKEDKDKLEEYLELPECDIAKHCGFKCKTTGDYFMVNSGRCDIFHRCFNQEVYTSYCAPGTFFDPSACACRHTNELAWCQDNGAVKTDTKAIQDICTNELH